MKKMILAFIVEINVTDLPENICCLVNGKALR
jgi:hypothetical protein